MLAELTVIYRGENYLLNQRIYSVFSPFFYQVKAVTIVVLTCKTNPMYQRSEERMRIARNIRLLRELRNYDQRYVASELEVGRSTLSTWENGLTEVKIENLIRLAEILGLDNYRQILDFDPEAIFKQK